MNEETKIETRQLSSGDCAEIAGQIVGKLLKGIFFFCAVFAFIGVIVGNRAPAKAVEPVKVEQPAKKVVKAKPAKKAKRKAKKACKCECKKIHTVKIVVDTPVAPAYNLNIKSVEERLNNDAAI